MEYTYKFRLYPNKEQEDLMLRTFGCCRFIYNYYLEKRKNIYEAEGKTFNYYDCCKDLTALKRELPWLGEVPAVALQASLKNLDLAYSNFFRRVKKGEKPGYPKFKSKYDNHQSYRCPANGGKAVTVGDNCVKLPKLDVVKCKVSKEVKGRPLSATVSKTPSGKYYVSLCCTDVEFEPLPKNGSVIGLDMGIKHFATDSNGVKYDNPKFYEHSQKKLARLQRQLSRKENGSNNREKARKKVAILHEHIANQRRDMQQKTSTQIIRENDTICIEDLEPKKMMKDRKMAKRISDASWGEFRRELEYKAAWYDKQVVVVDKNFPSTQLCSACGEQWPGAKDIAVRKWTCPHCGAKHDRTENAAANILKEGLKQVRE